MLGQSRGQGGLLGDDNKIVHPIRPDLPDRINDALDALQGDAAPLSVRAYRSFAATVAPPEPTPADPQAYLRRGRRLDLVLQFREPTGRLDEWLEFVRETIRVGGPHLASVQICEEPNADLPTLDGSTPNVLNALVEGVVAAEQEARALGHPLAVGFNAVPTFAPGDTFWPELGALTDTRFLQSLDYVGLDFFPDVFLPVAADQLAGAVTAVITAFRRADLPKAGIPDTVPIRVCENGWPTGPDRPEQRQAVVLETVVRTVAALAADLTIDGYSFFALRDADSSADGLFHRFGLLHDDYTPKPAFETYRRLISELGTPPAVLAQ